MLCPEDKGRLDPVGFREIHWNVPQLFVDDHIVENRFDRNLLSANVPHVAHRPDRSPSPILSPDQPWEREYGLGYPGVVFDPTERIYRMYYTVSHHPRGDGYPPGTYFLCYAESRDGLRWEKPDLNQVPWGEHRHTNIILQGDHEAKVAHVHVEDDPDREDTVKNTGLIPSRFLRGHRFLMYYCDRGHYLATSEDGIHWDEKVHQVIANRIDCYHTIVHDASRNEFVSFLRNKLIFGGPKVPESFLGNTRAISRVAGRDLWSEWDTMPVSVLLPDREDAKRFYGMPTFIYGDVYWGFLQQFDEDPQSIEIDLVFSRNGLDWSYLPGRPHLLPVGVPGTWDSGMIFTADRVLERDDEWWLYYSGHNGYHDARDRQAAIGLARFRKEGFVSLRAGIEESYVVTRPIRWPGGQLAINARTEDGIVQVRVTDLRRNTIEGFDHTVCEPFRGDNVRHPVTWREADIADLKGHLIRLEFRFRNADLFAFVATD